MFGKYPGHLRANLNVLAPRKTLLVSNHISFHSGSASHQMLEGAFLIENGEGNISPGAY